MKIIIDAMGGDNAPLEIVKGALSAHSRFGCDIVLTGDEAAIRAAARRSCPPALPSIPPPRRWICATTLPRCSAGRRIPPWARH